MREQPASHATFIQLAHGQAPVDESILAQLSVGLDSLTDFWRDRYLREYIPAGGSKIKFITGQSGSGKTHLLRLLSTLAKNENLVVVSFSAEKVWLHDFREIYLEILQQSNIIHLLEQCSHKIIEQMGFDWSEIPTGTTFIDFLSQIGLADGITKREIRLQLKEMFMDNPLMDNNFALACSLLCGGMLGHPFLEEQSKQLLLCFLHGHKDVKLSALRPLGISTSKINKFNARHMLRSLSELVRLSGYKGLFIAVDNLEILLDKSSLNALHYTKMRRDDTYESIRQLIDDIDTLRSIMFVFAFDRILIDNDNAGIKSYQALWMRIQNEIISDRINYFIDMLDLDTLSRELYTPQIIMQMSAKLAKIVQSIDVDSQCIDENQAKEIMDLATFGKVAIPRLVNQATLQLTKEAIDNV
ncbi:MAG: BREX system ATP-binding domain-containing protein [Sphaerochaetaceae bacterium]